MRFRTSASLVFVGAALVACADSISAPIDEAAQIDAAVRVGERLVGIRIDSGSKLVRPGAKLRLRSTLLFSQGGTFDGSHYGQWTSANPEIAKVASKTGIVTGIALGTASMIVSYANKADTVMVTVGTKEVAPLTVTPATAHLAVADTVRLATSHDVPKDGTRNPSAAPLNWESSDPAVVTVSGAGLVTAKGPGRATVVVASGSQRVQAAITVVAQQLPTPGTSPNTPGGPRIPTAGAPDLPRVRLDTRYVAPSGKTIVVREGGNLQKALDAAAPGDVIALEAGATFTGNFTLPRKSGSGWITIRSATPDASLPREGERITPEHSRLLAKIVTPNVDAAIATRTGAHHYRLMAVEVTAAPAVRLVHAIVKLGDAHQTSLANVANNLIIDRAYIHGHSGLHTKRCVSLQSASSSIIDSYLSECHGRGQDTQAIAGWNGPGPYKIVNNHLEGAGENVMFGGSDPRVPGLIPSDIEIRRNYIYKPLSWRGGEWEVKNLFELKNAQRVLVEENVFENSWSDGQTGYAILLKSANQDGRCPWCVTRHVTFRRNWITNAGGGVNLSGQVIRGHPLNEQLHDVLFQDNVFEKIGKHGTGSHGRLFTLTDQVYNIAFDHNTAFASGCLVCMDGSNHRGFSFTNNVVSHGRWGVLGSGAGGAGTSTLEKYAPGYRFAGNVILGGTSSKYPPGNTFLPEPSGADAAQPTADFRLSAYLAGRGAHAPGANVNAVKAAVRDVAADN
jgi:hypothetical protein